MCSPLSLLCPPLPPSAFPVPPSAAVMATGVSRAMAEPPLIGGCQAGRMEAWAALRCSQVSRTRRMEWGAGNPQISHSPCSHLGQAAGKPQGRGAQLGLGVSLCFPGGQPSLAVLGTGSHLGHSPAPRATSKGPSWLPAPWESS